MGEYNTASDVVKGLPRTQKGGFERTSSNPTGSATAVDITASTSNYLSWGRNIFHDCKWSGL